MTTAQQIIEAGFARSTASDAGKLAVDAELIAHLNRKYQSMHALMAVNMPDSAMTSAVLAFAGGPPSVNLPTDVIDILRLETSGGAKAYLIPVIQKDSSFQLKPAVYRKGNSLVSLGRAGDFVAGNTLTLFYLDAPATLSTLASTLDPRFPARYETILVLDQAIYLSIKDENRSPERIRELKDELRIEMATFLQLIGASATAVETGA